MLNVLTFMRIYYNDIGYYMQIIEERNDEIFGLDCKEIDSIRISKMPERILKLIAKKPSYPKEISRTLKINEQLIYYHIRKLEKSGLIHIVMKEEKGGAIARYYALTSPSFVLKFKDLEKIHKFVRSDKWLEPFVVNSKLNAKIIIGSPDPHGPEKARSRDIEFGMDLALFLGTFISSYSNSVVLDTDLNELKENLIIIGGPVTNRITKAMNLKLPVHFDEKKNIISKSRKYTSDDIGFILKTENPYDKDKSILVIAGKRYSGTKSAVLALIKYFDFVKEKNIRIVEGIDKDGDGEIDDVKFLE